MKRLFCATLFFLVLTPMSQAATRGDVKVIEASENIRYLSQKLVKEYLFFYKNPEKTEVKNELGNILLKLTDDLRMIATTTKDMDTKDVLEFLAYSKDQIAEIFNQVPNQERAALMLDYSEILLEGADSIARAHHYDFSEEEKMLMITKKMAYLLERITKYYMAINSGFDNVTNKESMHQSIQKFEKSMQQIYTYAYPDNEKEEQKKLTYSWVVNKNFLLRSKKLFIPVLILDLVVYLENIIDHLTLYHSKNQ